MAVFGSVTCKQAQVFLRAASALNNAMTKKRGFSKDRCLIKRVIAVGKGAEFPGNTHTSLSQSLFESTPNCIYPD